jgi:hypothetical protein
MAQYQFLCAQTGVPCLRIRLGLSTEDAIELIARVPPVVALEERLLRLQVELRHASFQSRDYSGCNVGSHMQMHVACSVLPGCMGFIVLRAGA